jgi:ubiquinone/menaquinone biosynthesis C-methylase UbiE
MRRLFAWLTASSDETSHRLYGRRKQALLGDLGGTVVELGPGTGANLRYYRPDVRWIGVEPNLYMHQYLRRRADGLGMNADLRVGLAEALDLPEASADAVVSTLVLCSVDDVAETLREVQRVLKPGGRFVFIEHVAAPRGTPMRRAQQLIRPVWQLCVDGCHPDRETWRSLEAAGFSHLDYERFDAAQPMPIVRPHIAGTAVA